MADRTLLICAGLVIVALLLFAGTGLLLMYKGTPGNLPAAGPFQKNDENMGSAAHGSPSEQKFQPGNNLEQGRMVQPQGQPGSRNDGAPCPGERINANNRNGPGPGCPCMENRGNQVPGNAPGFGPEKGLKPGQDKMDCLMSHGNQVPGNAPGSGPESGSKPGQNKMDCLMSHDNQVPGNGPCSGPESGSKAGQDKMDCPMSHDNQVPGNAPGSGPENGNCPMHQNVQGCHAGHAGHSQPGFDAKHNSAPQHGQKDFDQKGHENSRGPCQSERDNAPARG
ncbi:MAG: hypothetical protein LUQ50_08170 [Methanospirillum sp.]|uniref:hypothetical protein n=1 Tax=Methanospirillum sp. TaxID=45200 RepID=UPI00236AFF5D|nr:hypothetical protein [Methanospirillum sp.]MDD1729033.1 hypothetical protein [Methanospirillum sp.]